MEFHEIANVFPLMEGDEFRELVRDIAKNGQQQPILTHQGQILDGRNRYRACMEVGEEPWVERWVGDNPVEAVMSLNLHRRHLTTGQKSMIAQEMEKVLSERAKARQGTRTDLVANLPQGSESFDVANLPQVSEEPKESGRAREQAAKLVGVSPRSIQDAKKLQAEDPEAAESVRRGETSLSRAMEPHRKPSPPDPPEPIEKFERPEKPTVGEVLDEGQELNLPPFDLPEERRVYRKIITNLKDISKLDSDRIVGFCKGPEEADREVEYLSGLIDKLAELRSGFEEKRKEYKRGNLKAVN